MLSYNARVQQIRKDRAAKRRREEAWNLAIRRREGTSAVEIEFSAKCPAAKRGLQPAVLLFWRDPQKVSCEVIVCVKVGGTIPGVQLVRVINIKRRRCPRGRIELQRMTPGVERLPLKSVAERVTHLRCEAVIIRVSGDQYLTYGRKARIRNSPRQAPKS